MDSPISSTLQLDRLVLSNEPLTPAQSQFVHAQIAMVNISISRLDKEMQYFTQRLQSLRSRRGELAHTKEAYSNLLSPWRSLPTEILTEILRFTIVQRGGLPASAQLATLSQVCRRWSNVVQDTPGLWCELEVDERMKEADGSRLVSKLEKHYSRAGSMPWSISFSSDRLIQRNHSRLSIPPTPSPIVLFLKKSVRWKSIRFTHQHLDMLAPLFSLDPSRPQYSWPELEALHLKGWYYGPAKAVPFLDPTRPLYMGSMPRLTALTLHTFDQEISNWVLPWHQLTYLHLATADSYRHYLNILKSCPNLEECIISIPPTIDSTAFAATQRQQAPPNPIVLPRLHSLEVAHASIAWPFFSAIILPALTSLSVSSPPPDGREIDRLLAGTLSDMISRSACTLHSLTLKNTPLKDGDYVNILQQTIDLRRLDIVDWHASPPFWLEYVNKGDMIPRLKEMSMQGYLEKDTLLREYLFQFLECRGAIGYDEEGPFYADEVHFSEHVFRWRGKSRIQ